MEISDLVLSEMAESGLNWLRSHASSMIKHHTDQLAIWTNIEKRVLKAIGSMPRGQPTFTQTVKLAAAAAADEQKPVAAGGSKPSAAVEVKEVSPPPVSSIPSVAKRKEESPPKVNVVAPAVPVIVVTVDAPPPSRDEGAPQSPTAPAPASPKFDHQAQDLNHLVMSRPSIGKGRRKQLNRSTPADMESLTTVAAEPLKTVKEETPSPAAAEPTVKKPLDENVAKKPVEEIVTKKTDTSPPLEIKQDSSPVNLKPLELKKETSPVNNADAGKKLVDDADSEMNKTNKRPPPPQRNSKAPVGVPPPVSVLKRVTSGPSDTMKDGEGTMFRSSTDFSRVSADLGDKKDLPEDLESSSAVPSEDLSDAIRDFGSETMKGDGVKHNRPRPPPPKRKQKKEQDSTPSAPSDAGVLSPPPELESPPETPTPPQEASGDVIKRPPGPRRNEGAAAAFNAALAAGLRKPLKPGGVTNISANDDGRASAPAAPSETFHAIQANRSSMSTSPTGSALNADEGPSSPHLSSPPPAGAGGTMKTMGIKLLDVSALNAGSPVGDVPPCSTCACSSFSPDPFKKLRCSVCFHKH
eukprot:TRINITY_DN25302_c0_g1_i1.p1 TRINITY_DN25302_c0_g1~~TRINITY_DN25302_c0_g1_i1.p1  ORF type:complete len:580 (+),score=173.74 TRINITY_DN25302_c0_g1_i1:82-1821(+)